MKTLQQIQILEWRVSRDRLLDAYVQATAEVDYSRAFIKHVQSVTQGFRRLDSGINLNCMNPVIVIATSDIVDEIVALHRIADNIAHFLNRDCDVVGCVYYPDEFECTCDEEYDPYNEDVYDFDETDFDQIHNGSEWDNYQY